VKKQIADEYKKKSKTKSGKKSAIPKPRYFKPLSTIDKGKFLKEIGETPYAELIQEGIGRES
jgi:hypothetical protein